MSLPGVKTRLLILSDTHGVRPLAKQHGSGSIRHELAQDPTGRKATHTGYREPLAEADVLIHCGDLSTRGTASELRQTFDVLRAARAPLKLVIAGNHDLALDEPFWRKMVWNSPDDCAEARQIISDAEQDGVRYLTEGDYSFDLANGARLRVYASQYTPEYGSWAHQYTPMNHEFAIPNNVDVVMTHGPPHGILDTTFSHEQAGCKSLLSAVSRSKPKIHCFGHIHEAWGADFISWQDTDSNSDSDQSTRQKIVDARSPARHLYSLASVLPQPTAHEDGKALADDRFDKLVQMTEQGGVSIDLTEGENQITEGKHTLFLNAAIMSIRYRPSQLPWLIDVKLERAQ